MPTVSGEQVKALQKNWEPVAAALLSCTKLEQSMKDIKEARDSASAHEDAFTALGIDKIKGLEIKLGKLKVAKTSEDDYNELRDSMRKLGPAFVKNTDKLEPKIKEELKDAKENGWQQRVVNSSGVVADLNGFDKTLLNKIKQIVEDKGRGDHGDTKLGGSHGNWLHWRIGEYRIFGGMAGGKFELIGTGRHAGKGSSSYKVSLLKGGSTTAETD